MFNLKDRLICVNTFGITTSLQSDLIPGKNNSGMWTLVHPIIADLVSSDTTKIEKRKNEIGDKGYGYIWQLATDYLKLKKGVSRIGKPIYSDQVIPQYF